MTYLVPADSEDHAGIHQAGPDKSAIRGNLWTGFSIFPENTKVKKNPCLLCQSLSALGHCGPSVCPAGYVRVNSASSAGCNMLPPIRILFESGNMDMSGILWEKVGNELSWGRFRMAIARNLVTALMPFSQKVVAGGKANEGELKLLISGIKTFTPTPAFNYSDLSSTADLSFTYTASLYYGTVLVYSREVHVIEPASNSGAGSIDRNKVVYRSALQKSIQDVAEQLKRPEVLDKLQMMRTASRLGV